MLQQTLLFIIVYLALALPAAALTVEDYCKAPPTEFLEAIAESPRGKDDPIAQAKRVPIIFSEDGHVLVTDTDGEPYPSSFDQGMHQKMKDHKCTNILVDITFGERFHPYTRPHK